LLDACRNNPFLTRPPAALRRCNHRRER
jgi:hypothetical protein